MSSIKINIIHAFSDNKSGGNPAGVVLDADELSNSQKLHIAGKVGLSETAFVSSSKVAKFKLDFFTPNKQIPHCGHATIATFSHLKQIGAIEGDTSSKETIDGIREIFFEGDMAFMEQSSPKYIPLEPGDRERALEGLRISQDDLKQGMDPIIVNTGNNFLIVPVKDESILQNLHPNLDLIENISAKYNLIAFYPYAPSQSKDAHATTRMFGPYYGIPEEAATGMAAGPLACYLNEYEGLDEDEVIITQGRFMQPSSPSRILLRLNKYEGKIHKLFAGGSAYVAKELLIDLD